MNVTPGPLSLSPTSTGLNTSVLLNYTVVILGNNNDFLFAIRLVW